MTPSAQVLDALEKANATYAARSRERKRIAAMPGLDGRQAVGALLLDPPFCIHNAVLADVIRWPRNVSLGVAVAAVKWAGLSEIRTVGEASLRQLREVAGLMASGRPPTQWCNVDVDEVLASLGERSAA